LGFPDEFQEVVGQLFSEVFPRHSADRLADMGGAPHFQEMSLPDTAHLADKD
jgi:hypothetical protein